LAGAAAPGVSDVARGQAVFEELAYVARRPSPNTAARAALLLEQLILMLADEAADERQDAEAGWQLYQKCRGRTAERYRELSSLHELAKSCHVSEPYICRLFRRYDNVSPYRLIQRLRMAEAASLLLDLRLLVKQVAARVGYDDPFQFSKAFKREYGVSPRAFRSHPRAAFEFAPPARR
jgi:AraC-like DNA-binding protein